MRQKIAFTLQNRRELCPGKNLPPRNPYVQLYNGMPIHAAHGRLGAFSELTTEC